MCYLYSLIFARRLPMIYMFSKERWYKVNVAVVKETNLQWSSIIKPLSLNTHILLSLKTKEQQSYYSIHCKISAPPFCPSYYHLFLFLLFWKSNWGQTETICVCMWPWPLTWSRCKLGPWFAQLLPIINSIVFCSIFYFSFLTLTLNIIF